MWQEGWIELEQRFWPERTGFQLGIHLIRNASVGDLDEAACIACVVANETITEVKNVHVCVPITIARLACVFRRIRTVIPAQTDHLFQYKSITSRSEATRGAYYEFE